jgi:hypothetical protein
MIATKLQKHLAHKGKRQRLRLAFWGLCALFFAACSYPASAQPVLTVHIGFHDRYVADEYMPIYVQIDYQGPALAGELVVRQAFRRTLHPIQTLEVSRSLQLGQNAHQLQTLYFPLSASPGPEGDEPELTVAFRVQGREIASNRVKLSGPFRSEPFVLAVSDTSLPGVLPTGERIEQIDSEKLPQEWKGYTSVSRLYLARFHASTLTSDRQEALRKWLIRGGELVVLSGENFYVQDAPWLRELLPFEVEQIQRVEALDAHVAIGKPLAQILYEQAGLPLLVRRRVGQGSVYFSALDLLGPGETRKTIWSKLVPNEERLVPPPALGTELFRQMELRFPSKVHVGVFLVLYVVGVGVLSLWVLRRPRWLGADPEGAVSEDPANFASQGHGWRVLLATASWIVLMTGLIVGYHQQPAFTSRVQSLEIGIVYGQSQTPWLWAQTWYSVFPKRSLSLQLPLERDALVEPQEQTSLTLQLRTDHLRLGFSPALLPAWEPKHFYSENFLPLRIHWTIDPHPTSVRGPLVRVYNEGPWLLEDAVLFQEGIFYPLGDLPAGKARELSLSEVGSSSWLSPSVRPEELLSFEGKVKQRLYAQLQATVEQQGSPIQSALFAWLKESSFAVQPNEYRWTLKLLMIESPKEGG